jgi:hypothetical protein
VNSYVAKLENKLENLIDLMAISAIAQRANKTAELAKTPDALKKIPQYQYKGRKNSIRWPIPDVQQDISIMELTELTRS